MIKVTPKKTATIYYRRIRVSFEGKPCKNNGEVKIERAPIVARTRATNQKFNAATSRTASVHDDTSGKPCRGSGVDAEPPPMERRWRGEMVNCNTDGIHRSIGRISELRSFSGPLQSSEDECAGEGKQPRLCNLTNDGMATRFDIYNLYPLNW